MQMKYYVFVVFMLLFIKLALNVLIKDTPDNLRQILLRHKHIIGRTIKKPRESNANGKSGFPIHPLPNQVTLITDSKKLQALDQDDERQQLLQEQQSLFRQRNMATHVSCHAHNIGRADSIPDAVPAGEIGTERETAVSTLVAPGGASQGVASGVEPDCAGIVRCRRQSVLQRQCHALRTIDQRPMRVSPQCRRSLPSIAGHPAR